MKVLLQSRKSLFAVPGGDTIQILKTKEFLEKLGLECDLSLELEPDLAGYDIVHLFNITRPQEVYLQAQNARKQGKKILISPIYVEYIEFERNARPMPYRVLANLLKPTQLEYLKVLARAVKNKKERHLGSRLVLKFGYKALVQKSLAMCDGLLPNSESEMKRLQSGYGCRDIPFWVVPNAVDPRTFNVQHVSTTNKYQDFKDCVLCVARIEGIKNQLNVVRAMKGLPYKLVLVGKEAPNHFAYANRIRQEAGPNVYLLGQVPHEELALLYRMAKVHVLASWMETTGLSSLEAAIMNTNIVITDKGDTRDYFGNYAYYCSPDSVESIRKAIVTAWNEPVKLELRNLILKEFTWEKAAEVTHKSYISVSEVKI